MVNNLSTFLDCIVDLFVMFPADFPANHVYSEVNIKGTRDDPISASPPSTRPVPRLPLRSAPRPAHAPARPESNTQVSSHNANNITFMCFKKKKDQQCSECFWTEFRGFGFKEYHTVPTRELRVFYIWADSRKTKQTQTSSATSEPQTLTPHQPSLTFNPPLTSKSIHTPY